MNIKCQDGETLICRVRGKMKKCVGRISYPQFPARVECSMCGETFCAKCGSAYEELCTYCLENYDSFNENQRRSIEVVY